MINSIKTTPDLIKFVIWKFGDKEPEINIDGHDLLYTQLGESHHGLQCNFTSEDPRFRLVLEKCKEIAKLVRDVEFLTKDQDGGKMD